MLVIGVIKCEIPYRIASTVCFYGGRLRMPGRSLAFESCGLWEVEERGGESEEKQGRKEDTNII